MASEPLQVAQIIADLQTLQNADPAAALTLVTANQTLSSTSARRRSKVLSLSTNGRRPGGMSRIDSSMSAASNGNGTKKNGNGSGTSSGVVTPALPVEVDEDIERARTITGLFDMRWKFKQMGDSGLTRTKERVDAVVSAYAKKDIEERERVARGRHLDI